ncbi:hypothetical protein PHISCL_03000 [Aspergillus sclerotialis]|uniref:ATP-dependent DNA helicase n=1 Tax=Aspergillus sclerotialis TaxID=2070753 RepID=A0A3A3A3S5_9EURO|nr:hypothetical protein PHISCL_03000 [Aspergillus sclerotialis]
MKLEDDGEDVDEPIEANTGRKSDHRTTLQLHLHDEVYQYLESRYLGPSEAVWRLLSFRVHEEYPPVAPLAVHLPDMQPIYFPSDACTQQLLDRMESGRSTLMAFFHYSTLAVRQSLPRYLYAQMPRFFTWNQRTRLWQSRKKGLAVGRLYQCSPNQGERFFLRLLLTVKVYLTFRAACVAMGLLEDDREWFYTFEEAIDLAVGYRLRVLFVIALVFGSVTDPYSLWDAFKDRICGDLERELQNPVHWPNASEFIGRDIDYGLFLISRLLTDYGKSLSDFLLPEPTGPWARQLQPDLGSITADDIPLQDCIDEGQRLIAQLNDVQLRCFEIITQAVQNPVALYYYLRGEGKTVVCVPSSGIGAQLLPYGRTAHSWFGIPINVDESSSCMVTPRSDTGKLLRPTDIIIWDEVPMQNRFAFEAVDRMLRDVRKCDQGPFGGLILLFGGDFAQTLPVIRLGTRSAITAASLQRSYLWQYVQILQLTRNMRLQPGADNHDYARWLSRLSYDPQLNGPIKLPDYIIRTDSMEDLFLNVSLKQFNNRILDCIPSDSRTYYAIDKASTDEVGPDGFEEYPREYLRSIDVPGIAPSVLRLKVGSPIMLLRNLRIKDGLSNGTRMVVTALREHVIEAVILNGLYKGYRHCIPRIPMTSLDNDLPFR